MIKNFLSTFSLKVLLAGLNFLILMISANYMGKQVRGEISFFVVGLAIMQVINEIMAGPSLIHILPMARLQKIAKWVYLWIVCATIITALILRGVGILYEDNFIHLLALGGIAAVTSFHQQILLSKEQFLLYNLSLSVGNIALVSALAYHIFWLDQRYLIDFIHCTYWAYGINFLIALIPSLPYFFRKSNQTYSYVKTALKNGVFNQIANLAHLLSNRVTYFLMGQTALVGIYSTGVTLIESCWMISSSAGIMMLPKIANQQHDKRNPILTLRVAKICTFLTVPAILLLLLLPEDYYAVLFGKDFTGIKLPMMLIAPGILAISYSTLVCNYFSGMGKNYFITLANVVGVMSTVIIGIFVIPTWGIAGAAISSCSSYIISSLYLLYIFRNDAKIPFSELWPNKNDYLTIRVLLHRIQRKYVRNKRTD